jgi:CrcB protein
VIGLLSAAFASANVSESLRALLLVGLLGAFTTFSTFSLETLELLNGRQWLFAAANVVVSCLLGLAAVWAGLLAGRALGR